MEHAIPTITAKERAALKKITAQIDSRTRAKFERAFADWKETWFAGGLGISSDPHARSVGKEFDALVSLGSKILPLVVEALAQPDNFLALQLYDALQPDPQLVVHYEANDSRVLGGEQGRATELVKHWLASH
ncbi:MAG TPA: hypothetical protein VKX17_09845 [Planctomycetota bacterium]|nr:hypothetical protein [Planctomycetota bacterium]